MEGSYCSIISPRTETTIYGEERSWSLRKSLTKTQNFRSEYRQIWSKQKYLGSSKGGKEDRLKEKEGERKKMVRSWEGDEEKKKKEGVALQSSCHLQMPRCYGNFLLGFQERRTGTQPYQKPEIRPEPEFELSANWRWSSCDPQLRLRPFNQTPECSTEGAEKKSRIGGVEKRDERKRKKKEGAGKSIKCLVPYLVEALQLLFRKEIRDNGVPVVVAGSAPSACELVLEYPEWSGCQPQ